MVSSGDYHAALRVACSHLGPLASSDPALLKPLKETLLALLRPNEDALGTALPLHALAASLQVLCVLLTKYIVNYCHCNTSPYIFMLMGFSRSWGLSRNVMIKL